jgi:hypothetical protein
MAGRRGAAPNADRRKKLLLVGLFVLLAGLLAFQLPKLLKSSDSSSTTTSPPVATPATGKPAATGGRSVASPPTSAPAQRLRAIQHMTPRDPFVPLVSESAPASAPSSAPASAPASAPSSAPASAPAIHITPVTAPGASAPTQPAPGVSAPTQPDPAPVKPGPVGSAEPTAAVIWTNGKRHIVGVGQTFVVGDATFKLAAVGDKSMRLQVTGGSFADGKRTITVPEGREVTLENEATGVHYTLRFAGGTTEAPSGSKSTSNGS